MDGNCTAQRESLHEARAAQALRSRFCSVFMIVGGQNLLNEYARGSPLGLVSAPKDKVRQTEQDAACEAAECVALGRGRRGRPEGERSPELALTARWL